MLNVSSPTETITKILLYRKRSPTHVLCFTVAGLILWIWPPLEASAQQIDSDVARFVGEVVVGHEYSSQNLVAMKWSTKAQLSVFGATPNQSRVVERCVRKLNTALADTDMRIEIMEAENHDATLKVYLAPLADFAKIVEQEKISYAENNHGYFYIRWNQDYHITSAVVLLASDQLQEERLKHFAMEEITQTLGLPGDSKRFKSSLFYEDSERDDFGSARTLSGLDAKLLRFLYQKVKPGTHPVELGILMAEHWADAR